MKFSVELEDQDDSEMFEDLQRYLKYHPVLTRFLFNPAGFTFVIGWVLFIGSLFGLLGIFVVDASMAYYILTVMITEIVAGREVAIPVGLGIGVPWPIVLGVTSTQDLITTSWIYPLFYWFRKRTVGKDTFPGYFFAKMERGAEKNKQVVQRWGAVGLFAFMLIPFAVNGPLIGAILGKLVGIRTRYILPTVVLATVTATTIWTALYVTAQPQVDAFSAKYGGHWVQAIIVGIMLFILLKIAWSFYRDVHRFRRLKARREEIARRGGITQTIYATSEASPPSGPAEPPKK